MLLSPARLLVVLAALALAYLGVVGHIDRPTTLERIQRQGELVVVTRIAPATFFQTQDGPSGIEYELARQFAEELGVNLRLVTADSKREIFRILTEGRAHLAAAGVMMTESRANNFRFTDPYMTVHQQLVYRAGSPRPQSWDDVSEGTIRVVAGSAATEGLRQLAQDYENLTWETTTEVGTDELLYQVWNRELDYTVVKTSALTLSHAFHPELRPALELPISGGLAWAFPRTEDDSLFQAAQAFFERNRESGHLANLQEQYYGHHDSFDYVGTRTFLRHITERLPQYRDLFEETAEKHGLDWRLLAAIGYQESHWDPSAVSHTGVRGVMMLTQTTAREVGVTNRIDPEQSIRGGARYFAQMMTMIPPDIEEPVRTWMALAAYNVGFGHLQDARMLTRRAGKDAYSWVDVKAHLPLLAQREWYTQTRFGYARGWEPVRYVQNVRRYYELLIRIT